MSRSGVAQSPVVNKAKPANTIARKLQEFSMTRSFAYAAALVTLGVVGLLTETFGAYRSAEIAHERTARSLAFASELRARSDRELNAALYLASGLVGYLVVRHDEIDKQEIDEILAAVYNHARHIRNFTIAVGTTVRHVYPLAGNRAVIGKDYRDLAPQWPTVKLAMETNRVVLTGPVNLVQGGVGLIYRAPIFVGGAYWGMLSTVIDIPALQQAAFAELDKEHFDFSIRAEERIGAGGGLLWGHPDLFSAPDAVRIEAETPSGKWIYAVRARDQGTSPLVWAIRAAGWTLALLFAACIFLVLRQRNKLARQAGYDSLTELPNRRLFDDRLEQANRRQSRHGEQQVAVVFVDLNDFKPINDRFGHKIGDRVLRTVALRLRDEVRIGDTVARWAGDEFALILEESTADAVMQLVERLRVRIAEPFEADGIPLTVSAAFGCAFYPVDAATSAALLELADRRMYEDKKRLKRNAHAG